jgi:hypothetical protein
MSAARQRVESGNPERAPELISGYGSFFADRPAL